jgi:hypothetical protein
MRQERRRHRDSRPTLAGLGGTFGSAVKQPSIQVKIGRTPYPVNPNPGSKAGPR